MENGTYEVFILMEFCSGGGIIDMMNRRLRERLTEQEILTIFVDVCEGLAAMHAPQTTSSAPRSESGEHIAVFADIIQVM